MFPPQFARDAILTNSKSGDVVLDPFAGRGTTPLEALLNSRQAIAADINPVAACITGAKSDPPRLPIVEGRLEQLKYAWREKVRSRNTNENLTPFFKRAFSTTTLSQIIFLRSTLEWQKRKTDRFITALVLGSLHGESDRSQFYFSAPMPHSIATKPGYQTRFWKDRGIKAPYRDVFDILQSRANFRLSRGMSSHCGQTYLCDVRSLSRRLRKRSQTVSLVVTSPPYLDVTSFEEDQWLRLWFLGGVPYPRYGVISPDDRHRSEKKYWSFLVEAWKGIAPLLLPKAKLVCRIGCRRLSPSELEKGLQQTIVAVWPRSKMLGPPVISKIQNRQAASLQPGSVGCRVEMDFTFKVV